jgi:hypothetical protein
MSDEALLWMLGTLIGINSSIIGVLFFMLWSHIQKCSKSGEERAAALARLETQQERIIHDIGDHESGLRGSFHDLRDRMTPLAVWAEREMERRT